MPLQDKIVVTGGRGFIGSHLVDALIGIGYHVEVIDDCSANNEQFFSNPDATYHKLSILDSGAEKVYDGASFVFHLAAESRLQTSIESPRKTFETNVMGTMAVLDACRKYEVGGVVLSSTSSVYGLPTDFPIREDFEEDCLNPYASSKYAAELLFRNYNKLYGVKSSILRYFNVFGDRAPANGPYALVVGRFLKQKAQGIPLTVVGTGEQKRDFVHVSDVVRANLAIMNNWVDAVNDAQIFNVGSGNTVSINKLAKMISNDLEYLPPRQGEAINNLSSIEKLTACTGWVPKIDILDWIETQCKN